MKFCLGLLLDIGVGEIAAEVCIEKKDSIDLDII